MIEFIANKIMTAKDDGGTEAGKKKYKTYFSGFALKIYKKYKDGVDLILRTTENESGESYEDCIVE